MPERVLFIVNPNSGTSNTSVNEEVIQKNFNHPNWSIRTTEHVGHAREIAEDYKDKVDVIVAVGGDGTINEVSSALVNSSTALGIVPKGSGNGLSNSLKVPKKLESALEIIRVGKVKEIDSMSLNEHHFINMAGVGFDAHIAHLFNDFGTRGFWSYSQLVLMEFRKYMGINVRLEYPHSIIRNENPFVLSFANSSQYGNNAHIAPEAKMNDGLMDVCLLKKFPLLMAPAIAGRMFRKTLNKSGYYHSFKVSEIRITSKIDIYAHIDGEPIIVGKEANLSVYSKSIKVIVP